MPANVSFNRNFSICSSKRILLRLVNSFILAIILLPGSSSLFASEKGPVSVEPRFRVFALKHISTEQAGNVLVEAGLGTVSQLPAENMILVTGQPRQLIKASAVLKLFDAERDVVMKAILPSSAVNILPSNEQIAAIIGNMSIGSFSYPPSGVGKDKAIIDVHNDSVVVIASVEKADEIVEAIGRYDSHGSIKRLQKGKYEVPEPEKPKIEPVAEAEVERVKAEFQKIKAELNGRNGSYVSGQVESDTSDSETSRLFDRLLDSLAEAEKKVAELSPPAPNLPEPNKPPVKPETSITVPEKTAPNEPSVILEQPKEKVIEPSKEAEEPEVVKPEPKKVSTKLPSKREPNVVPEQVTIEVEEPNRVAPILKEEPNAVAEVIEPSAVTEVVEPNKITKVIEPAAVKGPYQPKLGANGSDTLTLDMPPKINIIDLLDLVGKYLNLNYMYDPADITGLKGEVTLVLQGPIKIKELYPLAESVLRFKGYVTTRRDNLITIVPTTKVASVDAQIVDSNKPEVQPGDVIITKIFKLEHIDTASAQNLLTAMKLGVSVSPIASIGTLMVTGYAYRMERIESLLDMIDKPGERKEFRFRELKYTTANTLSSKVKTLAEQLGTVSITVAAQPAASASTARRPGESTAAYQRRLQALRAAAARKPASPTTAAPEKPTVYLDADERTNRILMIGLKEQLSVVDKLIDALDVEQKDLRTLRLYEIQHVDAEEVMTKLSELGIISGGRAATSTSRAPSRTTPTRTTPSRTPTRPPSRPTTSTSSGTIQEPLAEEPQVVIIEATNSLLVNGTAEQHVQIAMIIGYVDAEQEEKQNPYVIYPLENQEPEELAGTLEKLISETITEQSGTGADSKVVRTTKRQKIEEDIFIVPDPKSYSLIVYASKKNQLWLASLIKELDEYRPQVLLDVTLVKITKYDQFSYALDVISSFPDLTDTSGTIGPLMPITQGSSNLVEKLTNSSRDRFIDLQSPSGSGGSGFYGDRHINLLFTAMQQNNYGRILARPKLLVNDNEIGTIKTETQTSIASPQTQLATTTAGTTGGTSVKIDTFTSDITLEIEPHISKGKQLRLKITLNRTDFEGLGETYTIEGGGPEGGDLVGPKPPDLITSNVTTVVTVPDARTIILGGLERIKQDKGGAKVPLLGDIPLLGGLFRDASRISDQSRLYVFIKAHILRPGEELTGESDIEMVSVANRDRFEKYEKEMQEYEDWPGIKPEPMDPLKILEADEEVSLRNRPALEKRGQEIRGGKSLTRTKSQVVYPSQVLELN